MVILWHVCSDALRVPSYDRARKFRGYINFAVFVVPCKTANFFTSEVQINTREFHLVGPDFAIPENLNPRKFLALRYPVWGGWNNPEFLLECVNDLK